MSKNSLKQLQYYVDKVVSKTDFINSKKSINMNSSLFKNICQFHNRTDDIFSTTDCYMNLIDEENVWTLVTLNSIIRYTFTQKKILNILATIAYLDEFIEKSVYVDSRLSTLRSYNTLDVRSMPFLLSNTNSMVSLKSAYSLYTIKVDKYASFIQLNTNLSGLFTETSLTLAGIIYSSKMVNVASNFSVSLFSKKI